jgi:hypothetical protein
LTAIASSEIVVWSKPEDRKVTGLRHFSAPNVFNREPSIGTGLLEARDKKRAV